jgi:hypothetical protein
MQRRELTILLSLLLLGWSTPLSFSSPRSLNVELCTFLQCWALQLLQALCHEALWGWSSRALLSSRDGVSAKWGEGARKGGRYVGGENFGVEKGPEKSLGRGRGWVFDSYTKRLERPYPQLVHWWLLVHSSPKKGPHSGRLPKSYV